MKIPLNWPILTVIALSVSLPACSDGSQSADDVPPNPDSSVDSAADSALESTVEDVAPDPISEKVNDASFDAGHDATLDSAVDSVVTDSVSDGSQDALDDSPLESSTDSSFDAAPDALSDSPLDSPQEAGPYYIPTGRICPSSKYASPTTTGNLQDPKLIESSGIAASRANADVLWIHNDSGDTATVYATGKDGKALGRLTLDGVQAVDWEDIELAPCPDFSGPCLWIADTGNNTTPRDILSLYVVPEPAFAQTLGDVHTKDFWTIRFKYPSDAVDSEALMVAPDLSAFYVIEKVDASSARVFAGYGPFAHSDEPLAVKEIATLTSPGVPVSKGRMITAADLHPSATRMLLRTYTGIYEYLLPNPGEVSAIGSSFPNVVVLGPLTEFQGEAVCYDALGSGLWSVSEDTGSKPGQPLHHYSCSVTDQPSP